MIRATSPRIPGSPDAARLGTLAAPRIGTLLGICAYGAWGLFPVYFKAVAAVAPLEVVCHRVLWSVPLLIPLVLLFGARPAVLSALGSRRVLLTLLTTAALIAANWLLFVTAVERNQVMQASLGYFINPLLNVLLGFVFLRERLRRRQWLSVLLAAVGVAYLTAAAGQFPAYAVLMAVTFGFYGLLRKTAPVDALLGLTVETILLAPLAGGYVVFVVLQGRAAFGAGPPVLNLLLVLAGPLTALPLLLFAAAARRLRLATMGFLQFLTPTGHFLLALYYGEPFTVPHLVAFVCIWTALAIYTFDAARHAMSRRPATSEPMPQES